MIDFLFGVLTGVAIGNATFRAWLVAKFVQAKDAIKARMVKKP